MKWRKDTYLGVYSSRLEKRRTRRKKIILWSFIVVDILIGIYVGIFEIISTERIIRGRITPKEELIIEEGFVSSWKYVCRTGGRYRKSEEYFSIGLDNGKIYKLYAYGIKAFEQEKFEALGMGSYVTLLIDENKGYEGRKRIEIAEIFSGDTYFLKYDDYVYQKQQEKKFHSKTQWLMAIVVPLTLVWWPLIFIIIVWKQKGKGHYTKKKFYLKG